VKFSVLPVAKYIGKAGVVPSNEKFDAFVPEIDTAVIETVEPVLFSTEMVDWVVFTITLP
jgi:hypothetical protein